MEVPVPGKVALYEPLSYPQVPNIPVSQGQESHGAENTKDDSGLDIKPESSKAQVPLFSHMQNTLRDPDYPTIQQQLPLPYHAPQQGMVPETTTTTTSFPHSHKSLQKEQRHSLGLPT